MELLSTTGTSQPTFVQTVSERAPQSNRWPELARELARMIKTVAEGPLYDRKRDLPYIRCAAKDVPKLKTFKEDPLAKALRSLIIDIISMLNSARRRGVPTYIVFGVDNDWKPNRNLIQESAKEYLGVEVGSNFLDQVRLIEQLLGELIGREMHSHSDRLIHEKPLHAFELEYGWLEIDDEGYFLCCIEFDPIPTEKPFMVNPNISKGDAIWLEKLGLQRWEVHSRVGESNTKYEGVDIDRLVCWKEIPFISLADVDKYCQAARIKCSKQASELYPEPNNLGKQQLYVRHQGRTDLVAEVLTHYLHSADNSSSAIILIGGGGLGKTTLLYDLALDLLRRSEEGATLNRKSGQLDTPLPIFVKLVDFNPRQESIEDFVAKHLATMGCFTNNFSRVFRDKTMSFVVLMDGVDEVATDNLVLVKQQIAHFLEVYPHIKVVITTRPGIFTRADLAAHHPLHLQHLSFEQVIGRIEAESKLSEFRAIMIDLLKQEPILYELLANPRMLSEAIKYFVREGASPISLGIIVKAVVEGFLDTEADKLGASTLKMHLSQELFSLAHLLWNSDELPAFALLDIEHHIHFLNSGVLQQSEQTVRFFSRYLVDYLLAQRINQDPVYFANCEDQVCSNADQYRNIVRFLANWYSGDVSDVNSFIGRCLVRMEDSHTVMAALFERKQTEVSNLHVVQDWLLKGFRSMQANQNHQETVWNLFERVTTDRSPVVFAAVIWLLETHPSFVPILSKDRAIQLLSSLERVGDRFDQLVQTLLKAQKLQVNDVAPYIIERVLARQSDEGLLFELYNWSGGVPEPLIAEKLLSEGVNDQIKSIILQKLLDEKMHVPNQWESDIATLTNHSSIGLRDMARRLLGIENQPDSSEPEAATGSDTSYTGPLILKTFR